MISSFFLPMALSAFKFMLIDKEENYKINDNEFNYYYTFNDIYRT